MSANFSLVLFVTTGFITIAGGTTIVLDPYGGLVDACNHKDLSYLICNIQYNHICILSAGARYLRKGLVITTLVEKIRDGFTKKIAVLLDFVQMRGGGTQIFSHIFISAFLVNKGVFFLKNANNLSFKWLFRYYT